MSHSISLPMSGQPSMATNQPTGPGGQSSGPMGGMTSQPSQVNQSSGEQKYDQIASVRQLVWALKESLANLMRVAANNIQHNSQIDSGQKTSEESVPRFDKALEDFFSICNQIEFHLKTILECAIQARDSQLYLPFNVNKTDNVVDPSSNMNPDSMSYNQYIMTIKTQVNFAKTVHDMLVEGSKRITQTDPNVNPVINQVITSTTPATNTSVV